MPELPEVETVRRTLEKVLAGRTVAEAEIVPDEIVLGGTPPDLGRSALEGAVVTAVGRKGKFFWLELDRQPWVFGHLGMAGWVREVGAPSIRLKEHGKMPFEDQNGRARFLKMRIRSDQGGEVVMTDGRRLARIWLSASSDSDPRVHKLGPDVLADPWPAPTLHALLSKKKAPIKAVLLDQAVFAGIGNWIADEVLYWSKLSPKRLGSSLSEPDVEALLEVIKAVVTTAVECGADEHKYPGDWLFHARWGGSKGHTTWNGHDLVREKVGGRTTAWSPDVQV